MSSLPPIPIDYVVGHARTLNSSGKRKPYVDLICQWAAHEGMEQAGADAASAITGVQQIGLHNMPREFYQRYRESDRAEQLIAILREISSEISLGGSMWTWAHVMRVMIDESILMANVTTNRFDTIICGLMPEKGRDTVRKNGNYEMVRDRSSSYRSWTTMASMNPTEATNREICNQIAERLKPVIIRRQE